MYQMEEEIRSQSTSVRNAWESAHRKSSEIQDMASGAMGFVVSGSGTSFNASLFLSLLLNDSGRPAVPVAPSEVGTYIRSLGRNAIYVFFSQSGESRDTVRAAREAAESGARIISFTNSQESTLSKLSDLEIYLSVGPEKAVAATKSFTAMLMASLEFCSAIQGSCSEAVMRKVAASVGQVVGQAENLQVVSADNYIFLGSGYSYVTAREAALKLRETASVRTEAFIAQEFEHGYIQVAGSKDAVVTFSEDQVTARIREECTSFGAQVLDGSLGSQVIRGFDYPERCVLEIIPWQLYAMRLAQSRGLNPDRPDRLTKVLR
ncbi:SIS domain-containing protein [Thermogymnomonas acidicola]|nr:SIS domain-containing protein [Thermogymnomonas acidicola]